MQKLLLGVPCTSILLSCSTTFIQRKTQLESQWWFIHLICKLSDLDCPMYNFPSMYNIDVFVSAILLLQSQHILLACAALGACTGI